MDGVAEGSPRQSRLGSDENVTDLLQDWAGGNSSALNQVITSIYKELRRLAAKRLRAAWSGQTLDPPALVHETYMHLARMTPVVCENRSRFFALAAVIMRRILV